MHVLVLKSDVPNTSYELSKLVLIFFQKMYNLGLKAIDDLLSNCTKIYATMQGPLLVMVGTCLTRGVVLPPAMQH